MAKEEHERDYGNFVLTPSLPAVVNRRKERRMSKYDYENEKLVVKYGECNEEIFHDEDKAVKFAKEKLKEGFQVKIEQIMHMVGWC